MPFNLFILTLNWNGQDKLTRLKNSLLPCLDDLNFKWLIKDNGSKDNSIEEIKSWENNNIISFNYKHNNDNYSQGMNFLFRESGAKDDDLIITLNNDIEFKDTTSIKNMIKLLSADKNIGIVGAKLNYPNSESIQHCGVLFSTLNGAPYHYRSGQPEQAKDKLNRYYPMVTGAIALMPTWAFNHSSAKNKSGLKGYNENFHWCFDDIDFALRMNHHLNKKIVYCGHTNIWHDESSTLKKNPVNKLFFNHNIKLFMENWAKLIDVGLVSKYETNEKFNLYGNG